MPIFKINNKKTKKSESKNFRIRTEYIEYISRIENKYDISQNKIINMCIEFSLKYKDFDRDDDIVNNIFGKNKNSILRTVRIKIELYNKMLIIRDKYHLTMNAILNKSLNYALNHMEKEKEEVLQVN